MTITTAPAVAQDERATAPAVPTREGIGPFDEPLVDGHLHLDATISRVVRTEVDVDAYTRLDHDRLAVDADAILAEAPLNADQRLALGLLQRIEGAALAESRAMLATWTGNEARITAFLATWLVERHWQSRALRDLLTAGDPEARPEPMATPSPVGRAWGAVRRLHVDRAVPLLAPAWTALAGEAVTAGHMARMAIQEATLRASLHALLPGLTGEARRVVAAVADRHDPAVDFFVAEAQARITRSRREARTARLVLTLDSPLHGGGIPDPDLIAGMAIIGADATARAGLRRARFEITRLLPGPDVHLHPQLPTGSSAAADGPALTENGP
ncbi:hypothetical protein ACXET9_11030 [Brachybacterium sp. DNPG3]